MLSTVPLFPGMPGGVELFIVLIIFGIPLLLLVAVAVLGVGLFSRATSNDADVERLERRVEELERENRESSGEHRGDRDDWN